MQGGIDTATAEQMVGESATAYIAPHSWRFRPRGVVSTTAAGAAAADAAAAGAAVAGAAASAVSTAGAGAGTGAAAAGAAAGAGAGAASAAGAAAAGAAACATAACLLHGACTGGGGVRCRAASGRGRTVHLLNRRVRR